MVAELAAERDVLLLSDEIYSRFCYDGPFVSPARFNPRTLVVDGFSKTYGVPGWRLGFAHGPSAVIREMIKLQQYSFVCAPHPLQWAGAAALDVDPRRTSRTIAASGTASSPASASTTSWSCPPGPSTSSRGCLGEPAWSSSRGPSSSTSCW